MFPLPMEPRPASSGFPFAIRARLSTEDSASDASSFLADDSDDNSAIGESEEEEEDAAAEDNAASLRRPFMPIARITGDDEDDDVIDELVFDDDDEEEEEVGPKLQVAKLVAESLDEGFVNGNEEKDDNLGGEGSAIVSEKGYVEEVERMAATIDEGGLELNDVKAEMDGGNLVREVEEDLDFNAVVREKFGKGFELELKDLVVEKSSLVGDVDSIQSSVMEVELKALGAEAQAVNLVSPEAEDNPVEIVKIEASGFVTSSQHRNEEAETKSVEAEFGVWEDMEEEAAGDIDSKNGLVGEKILEVSEVEADSTESEGFEATNAVGFSHSQNLEMVSIHDSKAFEPKHPEVCAVNMEAEKDEDLYRKVNSVDSESKDVSAEKMLAYPAQYLDNFKEKNDESRAVVKEVSITENYNSCEFSSDNFSSFYAYEKEMESSFDSFHVAYDEDSAEEDEHVISEWTARVSILENSESVKHILKEMEEGSSSSHSSFETSQSYSHILDGQTISNSDEEGETDEDGNAKELFDTSALAALLRAASGASSVGVARFTSPLHSARIDASDIEIAGEYGNDMSDKEKMLHLKIEQIRAKYLRLVESLGHSADDALPDHVLYRMGLIDPAMRGRKISEEFSLEIAKKVALQLDEGKGDFTFSCTILVLGKTGVGKSAAINSIFGEERAFTDPFQPATTSVREISGLVDGVYIRVMDTPGLLTSLNDQRANRKILSSIKKYTRRCPPDVVLYVDRLDTYNRDFDELPIFRMITSILGSSIWFNAIIVLTHAASAFPDGPDGSSMSYEMVVAQRSKFVQQSIWQVAGDNRLVNSVALVENHPSCRRNIDGECILPNGLRWRPWLLLLCYSSKILSEVNSLMKLEIPSSKKLFPFHCRNRLPVFLSSLLQSKAHSKPSKNQEGGNYDSDIDLDNMTKEVLQEDDEYDQLPPFKPLSKSQVQKLTKEQKNAYFDEYDYQLKLLHEKKCNEELKRLKKMEGGKGGQDEPASIAAYFEQEANPTAVAIPLPDMVLPSSFDGENPAYLFRFLEPRSRLLTRTVLHTHSWDHNFGYDGVSIDESIDIACQFPMSPAVQITKDKKDFTIHLDSSIESKHGENGCTLATLNIQPVGKQLAYSLQRETKFKNLKKNKTAAGILVTCLGDTLVSRFKLEDQIFLGKKLCLVASTGVVRAQRNVAYGVNLEVCFREKDYPIGLALSTSGLSVIKWKDFAVGANFQSEFSTGRNSKMAVCVGVNNRNSGQISIKTSSIEQVHIALLGLFSLLLSICRSKWN